MNNTEEIFDQIISILKQKENYIPRDYQTIGGMWTTDTWMKNDIILKIMDEGYTSEIVAYGLKITKYYNNELKGDTEKLNLELVLKEVALNPS